jgi:hypothetical protein
MESATCERDFSIRTLTKTGQRYSLAGSLGLEDVVFNDFIKDDCIPNLMAKSHHVLHPFLTGGCACDC